MRCEDVRDRQMLWIDGRLPDRDREAIRRHLDACPRCREVFADEVEWTSLFGGTPEGIAGAGFVDGVFERIEPPRRAPVPALAPAGAPRVDSPAVRRVTRRVAAAALFLALVTGGIALVSGAPERAAPWIVSAMSSPIGQAESATAVGERVRSLTSSAAGFLDAPMRAIEDRVEAIPLRASIVPDLGGGGVLPIGVIVVALATCAFLGLRARREILIEEVYRS